MCISCVLVAMSEMLHWVNKAATCSVLLGLYATVGRTGTFVCGDTYAL